MWRCHRSTHSVWFHRLSRCLTVIPHSQPLKNSIFSATTDTVDAVWVTLEWQLICNHCTPRFGRGVHIDNLHLFGYPLVCSVSSPVAKNCTVGLFFRLQNAQHNPGLCLSHNHRHLWRALRHITDDAKSERANYAPCVYSFLQSSVRFNSTSQLSS